MATAFNMNFCVDDQIVSRKSFVGNRLPLRKGSLVILLGVKYEVRQVMMDIDASDSSVSVWIFYLSKI